MAESWFKKKGVTAGFSVASLVFGFVFLNQSVTGNAVLNYQSSVTPLSIIGLLLVACAVVFAAYSIKR